MTCRLHELHRFWSPAAFSCLLGGSNGTKSQVCEEHSGKIPRKHKRKSVGMAFNEHDTSTRRLGQNRKAKESFGLHRGLSRGPRHLAVDLETGKILDHVKFETGNLVMISL